MKKILWLFLALAGLPLAATRAPADNLTNVVVPAPRLSPRPATVAGLAQPVLSLNGTWRFHPAPPEDFARPEHPAGRGWHDIQVPGEWVMQGFTVAPNTAAAYWRAFTIPADWTGKRVKLRFDTVHSDCHVFVNGQSAGAHEGCFTPFELDVTALVHPGPNSLALAVKSDSIADTLASASQYAAHPLGGITRKVQLFALPPRNLATLTPVTVFDPAFRNATLQLHVDIADETAAPAESILKFLLTKPTGELVSQGQFTLTGPGPADFSLPVATPAKWDPEHPCLYTLTTRLQTGGLDTETVTQRVGFKQVEVRGNQVFVNGTAVKLHGACRHEVDPLRGRSLTPERWRQDAELFRAANVNYVRTSHYPPAEEFLDLCDEYGFFVECEAPLCWVEHGANPVWGQWNYLDPKLFPRLLQANLENLAANRNHPCVTIWSLANESRWSPLFAEVNRRVKLADPSRPTSFHDQCWGGYNNATSAADIAVYHYPGENNPHLWDELGRPVLFGEYCHVECYNRRELVTDPGVRDEWGRGLNRMWDLMDSHPGCLGGAIWAGLDDVFCLPNGKFVGYGMWGCIADDWRRPKPEFWQVKKSYSPVRVLSQEMPRPAPGQPLRLRVFNRFNFTDLSEVKITWSLNTATGRVTTAQPPRTPGELAIPLPAAAHDGDRLHLTFTDPRGFVCDEDDVLLTPPAAPPAAVASTSAPTSGAPLKLAVSPDRIRIHGPRVSYEIDRATGQFIRAEFAGRTILTGGPALMVLPLQTEACQPVDLGVWKPLNDPCANWHAESVDVAPEPTQRPEPASACLVTVRGTNAFATGGYQLRLDATGGVRVDYNFVAAQKVNPRQWGIVLFTPGRFDTLHWQRRAPWSYYPPGEIGRPDGTARARVSAAPAAPYPARPPHGDWSADATPLGGNDFASTKAHLLSAWLGDNTSRLELTGAPDAHQAARAYRDGAQTGWLIAAFHTGGGDGFFSTHLAAERRPLVPGAVLRDVVTLKLANANH